MSQADLLRLLELAHPGRPQADLLAMIEATPDAKPKAAGKPVQRRVGSRPRSSASMERRRSWAASGRMPPRLAARFTLAEQAVLSLVAAEIQKQGACTLTVDHLAALAGVGPSSVRNAVREAKGARARFGRGEAPHGLDELSKHHPHCVRRVGLLAPTARVQIREAHAKGF